VRRPTTQPSRFVVALTAAIVVVLVVHLTQFPGSVPDFERASNGGTLLDANTEFTADDVYARLDGYGEAGRKNYAFRNVTVDVLLPLSVFPFLFLLARKAVTPAPIDRRTRAAIFALPVAYVLFDLVENSIVLTLLANYPARLNPAAEWLPYATIAKRAATLLAILVPLTMSASASIRRSGRLTAGRVQ
jgi:hypothetical protein